MFYRINESLVEKTAKILTEAHDINVSFKANASPHISKDKTIVLPAISPDAPPEYIDALQGYLDKQAAKVIFSTIPEYIKGMARHASLNDKGYKYAFDLVESLRAESRYMKLYPGAGFNIDNAHRGFLDAAKNNWEKMHPFHRIMIGAGVGARNKSSVDYKDLMGDKYFNHMQKVVNLVNSKFPKTIEDSSALAKHIVEMLDMNLDEEPQENDSDEESEKSKDSNKSKKGKSSSKDGKGDKQEKSDGSSGNSEEKDDSEGDPDDGENDEDGDGDSEEDGDSESSGGDKEGKEKEGKPSKANYDKKMTSSMVEVIEDAHGKMDHAKAPSEMKENKGTKCGRWDDYAHPTSFPRNSYKIFTTAEDRVNQITVPNRTEAIQRIAKWRKETDPIVFTMKKRLVNTLRVKSTRKWQSGKQEGRLDVRRAYRAVHGISDAVYKRRTEKLALDVAVSIAIDESGSMRAGIHGDGGSHSTRIECAAMSAFVLGDVLNAINVPFSIYGFTTGADQASTGYARSAALLIDSFTRYGDMWREKSLNLTNTNKFMRENVDGESVLFGVRSLLSRKEKRKVLFVLTDGQPAPGCYGDSTSCAVHLKHVVEDAQKVGVQVIGIGINTDHVRTYYKDHVVINSVQDLVKEPLIKLDNILRKAMVG